MLLDEYTEKQYSQRREFLLRECVPARFKEVGFLYPLFFLVTGF